MLSLRFNKQLKLCSSWLLGLVIPRKLTIQLAILQLKQQFLKPPKFKRTNINLQRWRIQKAEARLKWKSAA